MVGIEEKRVRTRDRDSKTRQLIGAAVAVFSEHGYEKATTREISERAGCAEGLIYKYFGGKRQLLMAALASQSENKLDDDGPSGGTLEQEILGLLQRRVDRAWEDRHFMRVCISIASVDSEIAHIMENLGHENVVRTSAYLRRLIEAGLLHPNTDVEATANIIGGLMLALGYFGRIVFEREKSTIDAQVFAAAKQLCAGLAP